MTVGMLASIIFIVIMVQVAIAGLAGLYRRRRQYREIDAPAAVTRTTQPPPEPADPSSEEAAGSWAGFREFWVQRREVENDNQDIRSFYLVPIDGQPLPPFRPGQFLTFRLTIEDPDTHKPGTIVRCYSLSDRPRPNRYRVTIKRVPAPAGQPALPPGLSSNYFHDQVEKGTTLLVKAPSGHFHLMEDTTLPIVLIGGGIGITPMLSILNTLLEGGSQRSIWLYYGIRNGAEQIMKQHLQKLAEAHDNFHLHLCYSSPEADDVLGIDYQHKGRIDIPLLRSTLKLQRYQFYVCGPKPMMESLVPGLEAWGVDSQDIFYESFGPATLTRPGKPISGTENAPAIDVTFSKTGRSVTWNPAAGSLLAFAEEQGITVESGCRAGSCGCCQTRLESGEIEYSQQPDAEVAPGHCLLCISTPKNDITLAV